MNTTTKAHIKSSERHVGIDVGKSTLDVFIYETDLHWQTENTPAGIKALVRSLRRAYERKTTNTRRSRTDTNRALQGHDVGDSTQPDYSKYVSETCR